MSVDAPLGWELQPAAGWEAYCTARARFFARLGMEARLLQIERVWREETVGHPEVSADAACDRADIP